MKAMSNPKVCAFVQARMSSSRFPGKVLAPLMGKPLILHLVERLYRVMDHVDVIVLTSKEASDDPLAAFLASENIRYFRGQLENTFMRFRQALEIYSCDYFFRISGDSPLFDERLIQRYKQELEERNADLYTNVFPRSFPKGQSLELVKTETFLKVDVEKLSESECEHVTPYFYRHKNDYEIINIKCEEPTVIGDVVVDTIEEFKSLESRWEELQFHLS